VDTSGRTATRSHVVLSALLGTLVALALVVVPGTPLAGAARAAGDPPDNDPHVGCTFDVEWYGFDQGPDTISLVTFEMQAPTDDVVLDVTGPAAVFVGGDPASGAGTATGLDGRESYVLAFYGDPQPEQGFHVKLTVHTPGSKGADTKSKVLWVEGCDPVVPSAAAIHLEKSVTDSADADSRGSLGELLTYAFTVTNVGGTTLEDVTISDDLLGLVAAPCVATLAPGESTTCPLLPAQTYVVTAGDVAAGQVHNMATATGTPPDGPDVSDSDDARVPTGTGGTLPPALAIVKSADVSLAAPGDLVTFTLRAVNSGAGEARDVVVTDVLPAGTAYVSASPACSYAAPAVTCSLGTIGPDEERSVTVTVRVSLLPSAVTTHDHLFEVTKIESHLSAPAGQTASATTLCPAGYLATDGSVRIDHIDQGAGTWTDVAVLASATTADGRGWTGTLRNGTTGQVQAKVNVVCMSEQTVSGEDHTHPLVVSDVLSTTQAWAAGPHTVDLSCGPGAVAIAPGFTFLEGDGVVVSRPTPDGRRFAGDIEDDALVTLTARCLRTTLGVARGHTHELLVSQLSGHVVVAPGAVVERSLTCRDGAKGIVAWVDPHGTVPLGTDPQPVTRLFRFYNPSSGPLTVDYGLLCVDVRTTPAEEDTRQVENTATVATSSPDAATFDDSSTATITVSATGIAAGGSGWVSAGRTAVQVRVETDVRRHVSLKLLATHRVAGTHVHRGTVLARGEAVVRAAHPAVRLVVTKAARAALRADRIQRAVLVVTRPGGARDARTIVLR
jgi:uncharacterized repeat protein (TIGR01451 family)